MATAIRVARPHTFSSQLALHLVLLYIIESLELFNETDNEVDLGSTTKEFRKPCQVSKITIVLKNLP